MRLLRPTLRLRMALLYGGLVFFVGVSLLITSYVLLDRSIARLPFFNTHGKVTIKDQSGTIRHVDPSALGQQARDSSVDYLLHTGLIYFGIVVIIGTTGGYLLAKQALRPIGKLTKAAKQISTDNLDQRIALGGPDDELRELADTFDEMIARLDAAFESQRLFVANASHELRTPLSVIRTELEVSLGDPEADAAELRRMGEVVETATLRAQHLVTSLLTLARLQAKSSSELDVVEQIDLASLVPGVVSAIDVEIKEKAITLDRSLSEAVTYGDPRLLERLIGNMAENAVRHNVQDGWLRLRTGQGDGHVFVEVANGGARIAPNDLEALFEPFRRGGRARTATRGAGLGLAIVRLIVEAHHGILRATAQKNGGLGLRIELPLKPGGSVSR